MINPWALCIITAGLSSLAVLGWFGWQLLRQNGRILLRLDEIEKRLNELELGESDTEPNDDEATEDRALRFNSRSLARSRIKRDGLKAGTPAPDFRLPRLDGRGELALTDLRGKRVLLTFSSPDCGPCGVVAPELEKFHRQHPELQLLMISKGELEENRAKVKEHGLTFPIVLQQHWEISRHYGIFATPVAYWIDEVGVITRDVVVGADAILNCLVSDRTADGHLHNSR